MKQTYQEEKSHCENKVLIYVGEEDRRKIQSISALSNYSKIDKWSNLKVDQ